VAALADTSFSAIEHSLLINSNGPHPVRNYFFEVLSVLLIGSSLLFFWQCIDSMKQRDYVAAILLMCIGLAVITVGKEMARLALAQKD